MFKHARASRRPRGSQLADNLDKFGGKRLPNEENGFCDTSNQGTKHTQKTLMMAVSTQQWNWWIGLMDEFVAIPWKFLSCRFLL